MTLMVFEIIKYCRNFIGQLKKNIAIPMTTISMFICYMIMIFMMSLSTATNNLLPTQHLLDELNLLSPST